MRQHRALLAPKFAQVTEILAKRLGEHGVATWTNPDGGYFVSLDVARRHRDPGGRAGQGRPAST